MKIGIIGAGVMGEVVTSSLLEKNVMTVDDIMISDIIPGQLAKVSQKYGIRTTEENDELIEFSDLIVICVKPQNSRKTLEPLSGKFKQHQVLISIMAGVSLGTLERITGHNALVRAMPNIPAQIGEGMTVWMASNAVSDQLRMISKMVFQAFGLETEVDTEEMVDAATAVSGSGPAYIFYMAENLVKSAKNLGFNQEISQRLVAQTFKGAMDLWHKFGGDPEDLRRSVTSKAGTTEAALKEFKKHETADIFLKSIGKAYSRARELREVADGKPDPALENE